MPRCEICGAILGGQNSNRIKILGKIRDFCSDCSAKISKADTNNTGPTRSTG